jgi:hypothetical protein
MPVTVEDVGKVFKFASLFYHDQSLFHNVIEFRLKILGVSAYGLITKYTGVMQGPQATETVGVIVREEIWKLLLPDGSKYSIVVEAYYAIEDCDDLDFCAKLESALKPLSYRVLMVVEGDMEEVGGVEAEGG